jgi:4-amino-4-deoxy-L-arabinose transferase-like glycosyltransferase
MSDAMPRRRWLTVAVFAAVVFELLAWLGHYALWDPDEGRHAAIARELFFASTWRGWIIPSHNFTPYHDKPILYYWLTSLAFGAAGVNEIGARLVSVVAALVTLAALHRWMRLRWGGETARLGVVVLGTSVGFVALGRYGSLDMLLACAITTGLLAAERFTAERRPRDAAIAAAAAGVGMLTKGLVAPVFIGIVPLVHALVARRTVPRSPRPWLVAIAVFLAVAAPWYVAAWRLDPDYLREFFLVHHIERFTRDETTFHAGPWWYYGPALVFLFLPWSLLLPATLTAALRRRDDALTFCLCWAATVLIFFSASHGKLATYILPALPPLAAVTARGLRALVEEPTPAARRLFAVGLAILLVGLAAAAPLVPTIVGHRWSAARPQVVSSLALLPVGALVVGALWWRRGARAAIAGVAGATFVFVLVFYMRIAPVVSRHASEKALAAVIATAPEAPIITYEVTAASLMFYAGRPIVRVNRPGQLKRLLEGHDFAWIVTSPKHVAEITPVVDIRPRETTGHHVLYATVPTPTSRAER